MGALVRGRCSVRAVAAPDGRRFNVSSSDLAVVGGVEVQMPDIRGLSRGVANRNRRRRHSHPHPTRIPIAAGGTARQGSWPLSAQAECPVATMPRDAAAGSRRRG